VLLANNASAPPACRRFHDEHLNTAITSAVYGSGGRLRPLAVLQWLLFGSGPLSTTGCDRGAFVSTKGVPGFGSFVQLRWHNEAAAAKRDLLDIML
jgi:hypothetical protein